MKKGDNILKSGMWFTFCNILQKGAVILSVPIFTRLMATDDYGMTATYQSWNNILFIIVSLALYMGVFNNGMIFFEKDRAGFISSLQGLSTTSALLALLFVCLFSQQIQEVVSLPKKVIFCMFPSYIFLPAFEYWNARMRFEYRYKALIVATIIYSVSTTLIPLVAVLNTENKGEAKILALIVTLSIFSAFFYILNFIKGRKFFVWKYWSYVLLFNIPLIPHYLSNVILSQSDRIMIAALCGNKQAGIYSVAGSLHGGVAVVVTAVNSAFIPWLYNELKEKRYSRINDKAEKLIILLGIFIIGVVSCTPEIIRVMASVEYYEAIYVVPPILLGSFFSLLYMFVGNIEVFYGKRLFMTCATMFSAVLNIFLNYLLIPVWGYMVCGYTTLVCELIYTSAHYLFMRNIKVEGKKITEYHIYNLKKILGISFIIIAAITIQSILYKTIIVRYMVFFCVCIYTMQYALELKRGVNNSAKNK